MDRAELQALQLGMSFALGLGLGFFYDFYRVWFRRMQANSRGRWLAAVGDIVWWGLALLVALGGLYRINGLELRFPILALTAAGVCVYLGFFSPVIFPLLWRLLGALWQVVKWLGGCLGNALALLLSPLVWLVELAFGIGRLLLAIGRRMGRIGLRLLSWCLGPLRSLKKHLKKVDLAVDFNEENDI